MRSILILAIGLSAVVGIIWVGFLLDRRTRRRESARWMRNWTIRTNMLADLYRRWKGPLRLEHQAAKPTPRKRKAASPRRKRITKG